jgi:hypothetical protein
MGKDFTSARKEDNVYTPYSMTNQFLEVEKFDYNKIFLEPACGKNAIVKVLSDKINITNLFYFDINNNCDFLDHKAEVDYIITNPPYSKLDQFIVKAKQVATEKFAFLCKITHLGGVERFNSGIYSDPCYPLTKIYMFTRQANLNFNTKWNPNYTELRDDGKYPAGMYYFCWLVWEKLKFESDFLGTDAPTFHWINNQEYILKNKD